MLARFDMAERIAYRGSLVERLKARTGQDGSDITAAYDAIVAAMIPGGVSAETEAAVKDHVAANAMNNFQRVAAIAHMLLVSPEFVRY